MDNKVLPVLWTMLRLIVLISIVFLVKMFVVDAYGVAGPSMEPSLKDRSTIAGIKYDKTYLPGEIILFKRAGRSEIMIGRVVALPGDTIRVEDGTFYLNGEVADEPYLNSDVKTELTDNGFVKEGTDITIPADSFFILGDNREVSVDSREWGLLPKENIEATYLRCIIRC